MSFDGRAITLGPGEGRVIQQPGHPITFKATAEGTRGAYSLLEVVVPGNVPTQHIHKTEEEAFYILEQYQDRRTDNHRDCWFFCPYP